MSLRLQLSLERTFWCDNLKIRPYPWPVRLFWPWLLSLCWNKKNRKCVSCKTWWSLLKLDFSHKGITNKEILLRYKMHPSFCTLCSGCLGGGGLPMQLCMHRFAISAWKIRIDHLIWEDYLVIKAKQSCNFYYGPSMCFEKRPLKKVWSSSNRALLNWSSLFCAT